MLADHTRFLIEVMDAPGSMESLCDKHYKKAIDHASALPPTSPARLGLMLNYAVFHYDIRLAPLDAIRTANSAFEAGVAHLDSLSEDSYRDATLVLQLLRDNITLWVSEEESKNSRN